MPSEKLCKLLGGPIRKESEEITQRHKDIASALQMIFEETMLNMLNYAYEKTNLVIFPALINLNKFNHYLYFWSLFYHI